MRDFERKSARQTMRRLHMRDGSGGILMLETLTFTVNLGDRPYDKKIKQKSLMFELSYKKPCGLCIRNMTTKIEELPAKKETDSSQPDVFLTSDLFLLR